MRVSADTTKPQSGCRRMQRKWLPCPEELGQTAECEARYDTTNLAILSTGEMSNHHGVSHQQRFDIS